MLQRRIALITGALLACACVWAFGAAAEEAPAVATVTVSQDTVKIAVGDEVQLAADVRDKDGNAVDVKVAWASVDTTVAVVSDRGRVTGRAAGETKVIASVSAVADTAVVEVAAGEGPPSDGASVASVEIFPKEAEAAVGDSVQFTAEAKDASGNMVTTAFKWKVLTPKVGEVDSTGLFIARSAGSTFLTVTAGALSDTAKITVAEKGTAGGPTVSLYRKTPDGKITKFGSAVGVGDIVTIGGLAHPMNFLNGMKLSFPEGSLKETITITFIVPKFAKIGKSDVTFEGKTVTAVTFEVAAGGKVVSPYYFDKPLELSLPYKKGLLTNLGIKPEDLGMYFSTDAGEIESDPGITNIAVDEVNNRITGKVAHFSTIVVAPTSSATNVVEEQSAPRAFALAQNVPNPFNPLTAITFGIPATGMVKLSIYNVLGQEVRTLVHGTLGAGSRTVVWNGTDSLGRAVTSGVYFYRLEAGGLTATRKLMLVR